MLVALASAAKLRQVEGCSVVCQRKQNKSNDQRALVTRHYQIKEFRLLDIKYHLLTIGLSSLIKPHNGNKDKNLNDSSKFDLAVPLCDECCGDGFRKFIQCC